MMWPRREARSHPSAKALALYAGSDLPLLARWRVWTHVARCSDCERHVLAFHESARTLRQEASAERLTGFEAIADWNRLEREMTGNIAVGVAAGRCIDSIGHRRRITFRGALVTGGLAALFALGWFTHIPKEDTQHLVAALRQAMGVRGSQSAGTIVRSSSDGIAVRTQGATLTFLHPRSAVVSASGASGVTARYVDEDSGQVTITNVYAQ
jgi:hypothetical protein